MKKPEKYIKSSLPRKSEDRISSKMDPLVAKIIGADVGILAGTAKSPDVGVEQDAINSASESAGFAKSVSDGVDGSSDVGSESSASKLDLPSPSWGEVGSLEQGPVARSSPNSDSRVENLEAGLMHEGEVPPWELRKRKLDPRCVPSGGVRAGALPSAFDPGFEINNQSHGEDSMNEVTDFTAPLQLKAKGDIAVVQIPVAQKNLNEDLDKIGVNPKEERLTTVIAAAATNKGDIETKEGVLILGQQVGNISIDLDDTSPAGTVVVGPGGVVKGHIEGKRVVVFGRVEGSIRGVTSVTLAENAKITGDVFYRTMKMFDGAEIDGKCQKLKEEDLGV